MKITSIDRGIARKISSDVIEQLKAYAAQTGFAIEMKGCKYGGSSCEVRVIVSLRNENGQAETPEREMYKKMAADYKLNPGWLDMPFVFRDKKWSIVGLNPRKYKRPVIVKCHNDGKKYVFAADSIRVALSG
jgi:hypothetical protein